MAAAWAIALASSLLGAVRAEGGLRAEGRTRTLDASGAERVTTAEVSATPRVALEYVGADLAARAQYGATLRAPDVLTSTRPDVLHAAELRTRLRLLPAWSATALAGGERGRTDLITADRRRQAAAPEAVPTTRVIRYASLHGDLLLDGGFDPRTTVTVTAGAFAGGGDDSTSRDVLPLERGVRAGGTLAWSATRRDVLGLEASALRVTFTGDREAALASLTAGWRRHLLRTVQGRVRAGAMATFSDAPEEDARRARLPIGEAGLAHASERLHLAEDVAVRLGAAVDRVSGTVERQVAVTALARWAPTPWSLAAQAAAARVRQGAALSQRAALELRVERVLSAQLSAGLGLHGRWQRTPDPAFPSFAEWGAFLSLSVALPRGAP